MSIRVNDANQRECGECTGLYPIWQENERHPRGSQQGPAVASRWIQHHRTYEELDRCALELGCVACQVFRRAILLELPTGFNENALLSDANAVTTKIRLVRSGAEKCLEISVGKGAGLVKATVALSDFNPNPLHQYPALEYGNNLSSARFERLQSWISACHKDHFCANYAYSRRNPAWLIQILPERHVRLISTSQYNESHVRLQYVALSYCWGSPQAVAPDQWEKVERNATTATNIDLRQQPFEVSELAETLQDAVTIVENLGLQYLWIDSLCVPKGTWHLHAGTMHEVYGNAYFTLSSCGTAQATERMLVPMSAWRDVNRSCRLHRSWITNVNASLDTVRTHTPIAHRGWILQEERLSPRILYWCSQRAYWSCDQSQRIEAKQPGRMLTEDVTQRSASLSHPQYFMKLCRQGDLDKLPAEWSDLVAAFTRRQFAKNDISANRFAAFSGLATRYLRSTSHLKSSNEYLYGLWRKTIAQNLPWKVQRPADSHRSLHPGVPSWSWLSLPLGTEMRMPERATESPHFQFLTAPAIVAGDTEEEVIRKGAKVKSLTIQSRLRRFIINDYTIPVPWEGVERQAPQSGFDFSADPSQSMFCRHDDGRVLLYEAGQEEIIAQLDYDIPSDEVDSDAGHCSLSIPYGREHELHCLEIGAQNMLLLLPADEEEQVFRRLGMASGFRRNFFEGAQERKIEII